MTVNGAFYERIFPESSADFTSIDVPFSERIGPIIKYVGFYMLFTYVYFIVVAFAIFLYYGLKSTSKTAFSDALLVVKKMFIGDSQTGSARNFYMWFLVSTVFTFIFFMFYCMINKSFLQELKFPEYFGKAGEYDESNEVPQPKLFIVYYAVLCMAILCFGLVLSSTRGNDTALIITTLITIIVFMVLIVATYGYLLKRNMPLMILMIVLYWAIIYIAGTFVVAQ